MTIFFAIITFNLRFIIPSFILFQIISSSSSSTMATASSTSLSSLTHFWFFFLIFETDICSKNLFQWLFFLPLHASCGVLFHKLFVGQQFDKYTAQSIASAQNSLGILFVFNMLRVILRIVIFFLSTTPFCCGDVGTIKRRRIPFASQNSLNSLDVNSPPLSDLKDLIQ